MGNIFHFAKKIAEVSDDGKETPIKDVVVTVPADANLRQRQAIVAAGCQNSLSLGWPFLLGGDAQMENHPQNRNNSILGSIIMVHSSRDDKIET